MIGDGHHKIEVFVTNALTKWLPNSITTTNLILLVLVVK